MELYWFSPIPVYVLAFPPLCLPFSFPTLGWSLCHFLPAVVPQLPSLGPASSFVFLPLYHKVESWGLTWVNSLVLGRGSWVSPELTSTCKEVTPNLFFQIHPNPPWSLYYLFFSIGFQSLVLFSLSILFSERIGCLKRIRWIQSLFLLKCSHFGTLPSCIYFLIQMLLLDIPYTVLWTEMCIPFTQINMLKPLPPMWLYLETGPLRSN